MKRVDIFLKNIIRIGTMSTKTWCLLTSMVANGVRETGKVSRFEIWVILLLRFTMLLLLDVDI